MRYTHTGCGGEIDVKKRQCIRCKKKWDPISFRLDPTGIRPMMDASGKLVPDKSAKSTRTSGKVHGREPTPYASWGDRIPGVAKVASRLPRWPRWARIVVTLVLTVIVITIVYLIRG